MMKKIAMFLACMLICLTLFTGCTDQKGSGKQDANLGGSVGIDDTDLEIDAERQPGAEDNSDTVDLPDDVTYSFRDPDHADGIVVTPRG